jgi:probable F420-dependent oxidoreductase
MLVSPCLYRHIKVDVAFMAHKAEELGFESFWCAEHPIMPVHSTSRFPGSADGIIPESYSRFVDPLVALARASSTTTKIKLGTGITLVPERNPLLLAQEISTLDLFSGGRFLFGIGTGWHREETQIMGGDLDHRWTQAREAILVMKELWTKEEAEFYGQYYNFPPVRSYPKSAQKLHPPVILGGFAKNVPQRVISWGDGWLPTVLRLPRWRPVVAHSTPWPGKLSATLQASPSPSTVRPLSARPSSVSTTPAPRA